MPDQQPQLPPGRKEIEAQLAYLDKEHKRVQMFRDLSQEWTIIVSTYEGAMDALKWVLNGGDMFAEEQVSKEVDDAVDEAMESIGLIMDIGEDE